MMQQSDIEKTTEARIEILKDKIDELSTTYDRMQTKMFAIVGSLLTFGGLLTYDVFKIEAPDTIVECIVFVASLVSLGISAMLICYDYQAKKNWSVPIGPLEEAKIDNATTYCAALKIIHKDYQIVCRDRSATIDKKAKYLNWSLYLFIFGVMLIIVLKIGN